MHCVNFFIPIYIAHTNIHCTSWYRKAHGHQALFVWIIIKDCTLKNELLLTELKRTISQKLSSVSAFVNRKLEWRASVHYSLQRDQHNMSKLQGLKGIQ